MIAERLMYACSKLATTREWHRTTLAEELSVQDANEDDLYDAMDWLLAPIWLEDEKLPEERKRRNPILPGKPSESVKQKKATRQTEDGLRVHSFETLTADLATRARITDRLKSDEVNLTFNELPDLMSFWACGQCRKMRCGICPAKSVRCFLDAPELRVRGRLRTGQLP